jgi:hypothetical protein
MNRIVAKDAEQRRVLVRIKDAQVAHVQLACVGRLCPYRPTGMVSVPLLDKFKGSSVDPPSAIIMVLGRRPETSLTHRVKDFVTTAYETLEALRRRATIPVFPVSPRRSSAVVAAGTGGIGCPLRWRRVVLDQVSLSPLLRRLGYAACHGRSPSSPPATQSETVVSESINPRLSLLMVDLLCVIDTPTSPDHRWRRGLG